MREEAVTIRMIFDQYVNTVWYRQVKKDDYLLVDGLHEALVSEEVWEQAAGQGGGTG